MENRKTYSKPFVAFEEFAPQEFVANCDAIKPTNYWGNGKNIYIDVVTGTGTVLTPGPDGIFSGKGSEEFPPNGTPDYLGEHFRGQWIEHTTIYSKLVTSVSSGTSYSSSYFKQLTGLGTVAVYISPRGTRSYVFVSQDGSKPNVDVSSLLDNYDNLTKTLS